MQIDGKFTYKTVTGDHIIIWTEGTLVCDNPLKQDAINLIWKKWGGGKYFMSAEREIIAFVDELEAYAASDFVSATWIDKPEIGPIERVEGRIY